jgi:disulfide bond formation protein DsbB
MDQTEIGKFVVSHWQDIALAVIIAVSIIGGVAFYHLAKHLERFEPSTWQALGRPKLFSKKSIKDQLNYFWYTLTRKYRRSEVAEIRMLGDLNFMCLVVAWILALAVITFGDLNRYDLRLIFGK